MFQSSVVENYLKAIHQGQSALAGTGRLVPMGSVASALRVKGTPFVLATGGHVDPPPAEFENVPTIEKPYTIDRVTPIIEAVLADADH